MAWLQFSLQATSDNVDAWSDALMDAGAAAVSTEPIDQQAIYESHPQDQPMWDAVQLNALFTVDHDPLVIQSLLAQTINSATLSKGTWSTIADQNWVKVSQQNMQPMLFGKNLWVCPSWSPIPDPNAINIILDPEMAFGTGSHATTALCLEWIADNVKPDVTVIDYGCGSGILAIAAAKMGAAAVYATDIDPIALEVSRNNAAVNNINTNFYTFLPQEMPDIQADVVIANIMAKPLLELAPVLIGLLKSGGTLVLSGILTEQSEMIQNCYAQWCKDFQVTLQDEWARITAVRM